RLLRWRSAGIAVIHRAVAVPPFWDAFSKLAAPGTTMATRGIAGSGGEYERVRCRFRPLHMRAVRPAHRPELTLRSVHRDAHCVGSTSLAIGADDLDARARSPMCHQRTRPSLGGEAEGRSLGFILIIYFAGPQFE